uniref:Uncharacterized protein n=1 Tax=Ditylenchus dipsaci TaxID=166011 RepID=A0A915CQG9_9BILA
MTCSVWLKQVWMDKKLRWNPADYGGVSVLYVPYEMIWYQGYFALLRQSHLGTPAIFKACVKLTCNGFHSMSNNATSSLDLGEFIDETGHTKNETITKDGIDLSDYYPSVEWDIMSRVARRRTKNYQDVSWCWFLVDIMVVFFGIETETLFYTVNLVFPCVGISFLTILVFYLPSDSGEKIALCISILVALTVFFLLLTEIIPATSISLPLIGKYLLFTMIMVTLSVLITVIILFMRRPLDDTSDTLRRASSQADRSIVEKGILFSYAERRLSRDLGRILTSAPMDDRLQQMYYSPTIVKAFENVCFIAELLKKKDRDDKVDEDWKYVAMVLDRLFLIIFALVCFFGTAWILLQVIIEFKIYRHC